MIVENAKPTESAITFIAHSTDLDNTVLSLEKENCAHGTLCTFPQLASEWFNSQQRRKHLLLVGQFPNKKGFVEHDCYIHAIPTRETDIYE